MEATGVYWKPVWHILSDGEFHLVLGNAAHGKNVAGAFSANCSNRAANAAKSTWAFSPHDVGVRAFAECLELFPGLFIRVASPHIQSGS
jgi:hypothetical protein